MAVGVFLSKLPLSHRVELVSAGRDMTWLDVEPLVTKCSYKLLC